MPLPEIDCVQVLAAQSGDREAFAGLVEVAYPVVARYLASRLSRASDASDAAQDVFVAAATSIARLRDPRAFWGWLFTIARRTGDHQRRQHRGAHEAAPAAYAAMACDGAAEGDLLRGERIAWVRAVLDTLPTRHADAIRLRHFEGLSYEQIAAVLGVPKKTVDTWLRRGLQCFRERFQRVAEGDAP